jgi:hypothetical protein
MHPMQQSSNPSKRQEKKGKQNNPVRVFGKEDGRTQNNEDSSCKIDKAEKLKMRKRIKSKSEKLVGRERSPRIHQINKRKW